MNDAVSPTSARDRMPWLSRLWRTAWPFALRWWDSALVAIVPMVVYLGSMSTYPDGWDAGEMQTVPYMLGITHPTGFPMFVLIGWLFSHLVPVSTVAWRMNLFCAFGIVAGLLAIRAIAIGFGANRYLASIAAIAFAFTGAVWEKGIHADVHALAFGFILTSILTLQRALVDRSPRWLTVSAALAACAISVHLTGIFLTPTLLVTAIIIRRSLTPRAWLVGLLAFVVPLLSYAYLPIRSAMIVAYHLNPNADLPFGANAVGVDWGQFLVNSPASFKLMMLGASSAQNYGLIAINPLHWPAFATDWWTRVGAEVPVIVLFLAVMGAIVVAAKRPLQLIVVAAGFAGVPFASAYGAIEADVLRYLLPSMGMAAALAAVAPSLVEAGLQRRVAGVAFAIVLAASGWTEYTAHRGFYGYHDGRGNQDAIDVVRDHVPDGAIVFASWLDVTALGYGKYIEGTLGSRLISSGGPSDTLDAFAALSKTHEVYVMADFTMAPNLAEHVPAAWKRPIGTFATRVLVQITPPR